MSTWDKKRNEIYSELKYKCLLYIFKWPLRREKETEMNGYALGFSGGKLLHKNCEIKFENEQINPLNNEYKELCKNVCVPVCVN